MLLTPPFLNETTHTTHQPTHINTQTTIPSLHNPQPLTPDPLEFVELTEALSANRTVPIETRYVIMHNFITPHIELFWARFFKHNIHFLKRLAKAIFEFQYFQSLLFFHVVDALLARPRFKKLEDLIMLYQMLNHIKDNQLTEFSFEDQIPIVKSKIEENSNHKWVYDTKLLRFKTYREMYHNRENADLTGLVHEHDSFRVDKNTIGRDDQVWDELRDMLLEKRDFVRNQRDHDKGDPFIEDESKDIIRRRKEAAVKKEKYLVSYREELIERNDNIYGIHEEYEEPDFDEHGDPIYYEKE